MSKSIVIDKEIYTRTKKKLKKSLAAKGCSFTLSEVSDILAQSFGFKNEFDMQKKYFNIEENVSYVGDKKFKSDFINPFDIEIKKDLIPEKEVYFVDIGHASKGINEVIINNKIKRERRFIDVKKILSCIEVKKIKGNIIVYGQTNTGTTTLVDLIYDKMKYSKLETLEYYIEEDINFEQNDLRKHEIYFGKTKYGMSAEPDQKAIRCQSHMDKLLKINNEGYHVVCDMHASNEFEVYQRLNYWGNKNLNIHYLIGVSFIDGKQQVIVNDLIQNKVCKLFDNEIKTI